jgi:hypothetical protein
MSAPHQTKPGQSATGDTGQIVLILVVVFSCLAAVCCGGIGVLGAIFYTRAEKSIAEVQQSLQESIRNPPLPKWEDDWVAMHALTAVYTAVVDAAVGNPQLIERLGAPMETVDNDAGLFRRQRKGILDAQEVFEFDLQGPKGKATIQVECSTSAQMGLHQPIKVIAKFDDDTELELPAPEIK